MVIILDILRSKDSKVEETPRKTEPKLPIVVQDKKDYLSLHRANKTGWWNSYFVCVVFYMGIRVEDVVQNKLYSIINSFELQTVEETTIE